MYCQIHWSEVTWKMHTIVDEQRASHKESWLKTYLFLSVKRQNNNKFCKWCSNEIQMCKCKSNSMFFFPFHSHTLWFRTNAEGKGIRLWFVSFLFAYVNEFHFSVHNSNANWVFKYQTNYKLCSSNSVQLIRIWQREFFFSFFSSDYQC